ncbi:ampG domain protein [Rickettsia bellii str. RML An4]|uniref:AmpG domain protein n=1 Tax=Rickettsia bellii str. RML An4 TaxID=1359193 RepID=A0A0F3QAG8_RICBE|nr:ampG domain protein [Rickettsia bellii str. RML An4]
MLDHGIQKATFNTNNFSILSWIPLQARRMTEEKLIYASKPHAGMTLRAFFDPRG